MVEIVAEVGLVELHGSMYGVIQHDLAKYGLQSWLALHYFLCDKVQGIGVDS